MIDLDVIETEIDNTIRHYGGVALMQCSYVKELITRLRQAEKDAARYRWLRDESAFTSDNAPLVFFTDCNGDATIFNAGCVLHDEDLDLAIDEAMQCNGDNK